MRIYIKKSIYFNVTVSHYFSVPFFNKSERAELRADNILKCSVVSWDKETKAILIELGEQEISLLGTGAGYWEIYIDQVQDKPDTEKWNNPQEDDDLQAENGRTAMRDLDEFVKGRNMLFI